MKLYEVCNYEAMRKLLAFSLLLSLTLLLSDQVCGQEFSDLWGREGEKWKPEGRLPDFSYAGYHFGEEALPTVKAVCDVTQFGARGDGKTDCTQAFLKAIEVTDKGAIMIPAGRYLVSDIIWIKKPGIVLRGAGEGKTVIYFTRELEDVRPNMGATTEGRPTSNYSWSGGFIWVVGTYQEKTIAPIISENKRGSRQLTLAKATKLKKGQEVMVEVRDDGKNSLLSHLYSEDPGSTKRITKAIKTRMVSRIESVEGKALTLERPLRFDIRKTWQPVLKSINPTVTEVGIEDLTIEFPVKPYLGHFTERGMNGIAMTKVANCWVKNVRISNSDSGVYLSGAFCTVDGLVIDSQRKAYKGTTGHHGIFLGMDNLVRNFDIRTHFIHDLGFGYLSNGNVYKNGKGINLSLDHHKKAPYENLFTNLDAGEGSEIWRCGGGRDLGKHCGARGTFWNIRTGQSVIWPPVRFGPDSMNLVGLKIEGKSIKNLKGKWLETIPPEQLKPADLHAAQLERRLKRKSGK